jgi:hypothetical protein
LKYEVVETTPGHLRQMARLMRAEDRAEIEGFGLSPKRTLLRLYAGSGMTRTAFVDGELAAVWGLEKMLLSDVGQPWLFTTAAVERVPMAFFRETRRQVAEMMEGCRRLETKVLASYERSIRFFEMMGFRISRAAPLGLNGELYRTMTLDRPVRRTTEHAPFVVFSLPRSRSRWLTQFLGGRGWNVHCDLPVDMASLTDVLGVLAQPCTGTVETGIARAAYLLREAFPKARFAVVRRPIADVEASAARLGWAFPPGHLEREDAALDAIEIMPGTLSVSFQELETLGGCRAIYEHCREEALDLGWWSEMDGRNVQVSPDEWIAKLVDRQDRINALFREIDDRVTVQIEDFDALYRDGQELFAEHYLEAGSFADLPLDPNVEMARAMAAAGQLVVTTARKAGALIGYLVFLINPCFESRHTLLGFQNIFFVRKGHRGIGTRMHALARAELKARGVSMLILRSGVRASGQKQKHLFSRLGAREMGELYYLPLGD